VYNVAVLTTILDEFNLPLAEQYTWTFNTSTYPTIVSCSLVPNTTLLSYPSTLFLVFDKEMVPRSFCNASVQLRRLGTTDIHPEITLSNFTKSYDPVTKEYTMTATPRIPFPNGSYRLTVASGDAGVKDTVGNSLAVDYIVPFAVNGPIPVPTWDTSHTTAQQTPFIGVYWNVALSALSVSSRSVIVTRQQSGTAAPVVWPGALSLENNGTSLFFKPSVFVTGQYRISILPTLTDKVGNHAALDPIAGATIYDFIVQMPLAPAQNSLLTDVQITAFTPGFGTTGGHYQPILGTLQPTFAPDVHEYTLNTSSDATDIPIAPVPAAAVSTATVQFNGGSVSPASPSNSLPTLIHSIGTLLPGDNVLVVVLTSQDLSASTTYTFHIHRLLSVTALSVVELSPDVGSSTNATFYDPNLAYQASLPSATSTDIIITPQSSTLAWIRLMGQANWVDATKQLDGTWIGPSGALPTSGLNNVYIHAEAEDGTQIDYTLTIDTSVPPA